MEFTTPWTLAELGDIHFDQIEGNNEIWFAHHNHPQQHLTYNGGTFAFSAITFTSPPASWTGTEYPDSVAIHQGRAWFCRKRALWGSKPTDYTDFSLGTAAAGDAIEVVLATEAAGLWLKSAKELLIGTRLGVYRVAAFQGILTPSDIDIRRQVKFGADSVQAIELGDEAAFSSRNHRQVRACVYDHDNGWAAPDLTWASEHITAGKVKELHFAPEPNMMVLAITEDGDFLSCTYNKSDDAEQESKGWAQHSSEFGTFLSMCVVSDSEASLVYVAFKQAVSGNIVINTFAIHDEDHYELDSVIVRPVETGNVVTGLTHLEGETVSILLDDAVHADKTVASGQVTLDTAGDIAALGFGYSKYMKTLPVDVGSPQGSGSGLMKHWNKIFVRIYNSAIFPLINGVRADDRSVETPMDSPEPYDTIDISGTSLGWDREGIIEVEQDLPVSLTVTGIFGEMGQKGL